MAFTQGPCQPYVDLGRLLAATDLCQEDIDQHVAEVLAAIEQANLIVWELFAHQYNGICCAAVRACRAARCPGRCRCSLDRVYLEEPIHAVHQVWVDGAELDSAAYAVFSGVEGRFVARIDGSGWPGCSDLTAAAAAPGSFVIVYSFGFEHPAWLVAGAVELAEDLVMAAIGRETKLPSNVTAVAGFGMSYSIGKKSEAVRERAAVFPSLATALATANPSSTRIATQAWADGVDDFQLLRTDADQVLCDSFEVGVEEAE